MSWRRGTDGCVGAAVDDFLASGSESSQSAAKGFAQGSGIDVHASVGAVLFAYAVSRRAYHAGGV